MATATATGNALRPDTLVERYSERIYRIARRMSRNEMDAEDIVQNTLLKILRKADTYRGESDAMGWIYRITMNEARELHRRRSRRPAVSLNALDIDFDDSHQLGRSTMDVNPASAAINGEIDDLVQRAIGALRADYRQAVVLRDLEGLPYQDGADAMGLSLGAFKTRLHRGRLILRERLAQLGVVSSRALSAVAA